MSLVAIEMYILIVKGANFVICLYTYHHNNTKAILRKRPGKTMKKVYVIEIKGSIKVSHKKKKDVINTAKIDRDLN